MIRFLHRLRYTAALGAIATAFTGLFILTHLRQWPLAPDALHTISFNEQGTTLYMPTFQGQVFYLCWWGYFPCFLTVIVTAIIERLQRFQRPSFGR